MITREYRENHPIKPFRSLTIRRSTGATVCVNAGGVAQLYPAIDMSRSLPTPLGRTMNDYIGFPSDEFPKVYNYLKDALEHWQGVNYKEDVISILKTQVGIMPMEIIAEHILSAIFKKL